jgi:hypothetical protein
MNFYRAVKMKSVLLFCALTIQMPLETNAQNLPFDTTTHFSGSGNCLLCHTPLTDAAGQDVSIDKHWQSTMMANAARDLYFQAKVEHEVQLFPDLSEVIQDKCTNCHMPMAHTQAVIDGTATYMLNDGFLHPEHSFHNLAMDGVSCTLCHQIEDDNLGQKETMSGAYPINVELEKPNRVNYGPFPNPDQIVMQNVSSYIPVESEHISESKLCATCHVLYTPFLDDEGNIQGEFPEQTIFFEWQHSQFGDGGDDDLSCQQCHMPYANGGVVIATLPNNLPERSPFSQHHFVGGNSFMLKMLRDNADEIGVAASEEYFNATIDRTLDQLQNRTAELTINEIELVNNQLSFQTQILNNVGHKFPAGFPSRRAWIHVVVKNAQDETIFESGKPIDDGRIDGNNADIDITTYEPHYQTITDSDQVQIYEAIMMDLKDNVTYSLLKASQYIKDNRLIPQGFNKETAHQDFSPKGGAMQDPNFTQGNHTTDFQLDVSNQPVPLSVSVELLYQSVGYPFTYDFRPISTPIAGSFVRYYDEADKTPVTISSDFKDDIRPSTSIDQWSIYN